MAGNSGHVPRVMVQGIMTTMVARHVAHVMALGENDIKIYQKLKENKMSLELNPYQKFMELAKEAQAFVDTANANLIYGRVVLNEEKIVELEEAYNRLKSAVSTLVVKFD